MFYNEAVMSMKGVPTVSDTCIIFFKQILIYLSLMIPPFQVSSMLLVICPCGPVVMFSSLWQVNSWSESTW